MEMFADTNPWILFLVAALIGVLFGLILYRIYRFQSRKSAEIDAEEILQDAKERNELQLLEEKERIQEIEGELWAKDEPTILKIEENIEELEELVTEKKQKIDERLNQQKQKLANYEAEVLKGEKSLQEKEKYIQGFRDQIKALNQELVQKISDRIQVTPEKAMEEIIEGILQESKLRAEKYLERSEEDTKEHSESRAKYLIDCAIVRFHRAYCGERGISAVYFETPEQRPILCDPEGKNIQTIQELTGCDIIVQDDMDIVGVAGFDPVRRELTRRILDRILKEKKPVRPEFIREKFEHIKRELFALIKRDGDSLAKELGLHGLHPEIRQMMGSLRYRYSFTQNQYFHCGEVGWLAGLLAEELGHIDVKKARRAGMLHDLGKSMDHQLDGGHAVIGANFIEARKEAADIVYAVRAHHFDVQPSHDLDFLVIAADAISGSRPGARRSTMETYNQKITELDAIARSFDGVTDCFVLSGGREIRVLVNSKKIDDLAALKIGKEIATRIENECNYPGQIKVLIVRESYAVESTRAH